MWVVLVHNSFHWKFENARENYDANHPLLCAPNQIITSLTRFAIALAKLLVKIRVSMESNFWCFRPCWKAAFFGRNKQLFSVFFAGIFCWKAAFQHLFCYNFAGIFAGKLLLWCFFVKNIQYTKAKLSFEVWYSEVFIQNLFYFNHFLLYWDCLLILSKLNLILYSQQFCTPLIDIRVATNFNFHQCDHTLMETPVLVRSQKLSISGLDE